MRFGNQIYDASIEKLRHQLLNEREAANLLRLYDLHVNVGRALPVRLVDDHKETTLLEQLRLMSEQHQTRAALFIQNSFTVTFITSPNHGILFVDSHSHGKFGGAAVLHTALREPGDLRRFLFCVSVFCNMNETTYGNLIPVYHSEARN